jgi:single-stranded-DNA-specific exonuclease
MATAKDVIELFLTDDASRAKEIAESLDALNRDRQQVEAEIVEKVLKQCEEQAVMANTAAFVFAGDDWHLGVLGIVASRLVERLCRPVFVLSQSSSMAEDFGAHLSGSGRSIVGFHLLEALETMPELFAKFGGHRQAAGVTLPVTRLEEFQQRFHEHAAGVLSEQDMRPLFTADTDASFPEFTDEGAEQLQRLGPFGFGNAAPLFHVRGAEVAGPVKALTEGKHFNVPLRHEGRMLFSKAWNFGEREELFQPGVKLDLLVQLEDDAYSRKRGYSPWCVVVKDARTSE